MLIPDEMPIETGTRTLERALCLVILVSMILVVTTILSVPKAGSYEISIYGAYPLFFWFAIATSIFASLALQHLRALGRTSTRMYLLSYPVLLMMSGVLVTMPLLRGYFLYGRADVLTQIGWINDILDSGFVAQSDNYPSGHIMAATISMLTTMGCPTLTMTVPQIFTLTYFLFLLAIVRRLFEGKSNAIATFGFLSILLFNSANTQVISYVLLAPYAQSFFLFTAIIYLFLKRSGGKRIIALNGPIAVLIIAIILFHPLTSLMLICYLTILMMLDRQQNGNTQTTRFRRTEPQRYLLLSLAVFLMWRSYISIVTKSLGNMYDWLLLGAGESEFDVYSNLISYAQPGLADLAVLILLVYGPFMVLCALMLFSILSHSEKWAGIDVYIRRLSISCFAVFSAIALVAFVSPFVVPFGRIFAFSIVFILLLVPSRLLESEKPSDNRGDSLFARRRLRQFAVFGLVLFLVSCSVLTLFLSPIVKYGNQQVTYSEMEGTSSFFQNRDDRIAILSLGLDIGRFYEASFGRTQTTYTVYDMTDIPPDHFGYDGSACLGDSLDAASYLVISEAGRAFYPSVYPEYEDLWRYSQEDLERLQTDVTVHQILDNGDVEISIVLPY